MKTIRHQKMYNLDDQGEMMEYIRYLGEQPWFERAFQKSVDAIAKKRLKNENY